jgi:hypothetical protein
MITIFKIMCFSIKAAAGDNRKTDGRRRATVHTMRDVRDGAKTIPFSPIRQELRAFYAGPE